EILEAGIIGDVGDRSGLARPQAPPGLLQPTVAQIGREAAALGGEQALDVARGDALVPGDIADIERRICEPRADFLLHQRQPRGADARATARAVTGDDAAEEMG